MGGNSGSKPWGWNVIVIIRWQDNNTAFMHIAPWVIHGTSKWEWTISSWAAETGRKSERRWIIGVTEVLCGDSLGIVCRVRRIGVWRRNPGKHRRWAGLETFQEDLGPTMGCKWENGRGWGKGQSSLPSAPPFSLCQLPARAAFESSCPYPRP